MNLSDHIHVHHDFLSFNYIARKKKDNQTFLNIKVGTSWYSIIVVVTGFYFYAVWWTQTSIIEWLHAQNELEFFIDKLSTKINARHGNGTQGYKNQ